MKKHAFRIGLVVTMLLGLMMISSNAACTHANPHGTGASHDGWTALTDTTGTKSLTSGKTYYLSDTDGDGKVTFGGVVTANGTVTLCLNGLTMDFTVTSGKCFNVAKNATFNICDCSANSTGKIIASGTGSGNVKIIHTSNTGATVNLWNGTIGKISATGTSMGSVAYFEAGTGTFNMHGGKIIDQDQGSAALYFYSTGTFTMDGGTISNALKAVNGRRALTVNITGGTIEHTTSTSTVITASYSGSTVSIGGDAVVTGEVALGSIVPTITGGTFTDDTVLGFVDTDNYVVIGGKVWSLTDPNLPDIGTELEGHEGRWFELKDGVVIEDGKQYYLKEDVTLADTLTVAGNATICLHDHTLTSAASGDAIIVNESKSMTIQDCGTNGTITTSAADARAFNVTGTLNIKGGTITGFTTSGNGGAVLLQPYGDLNLSAGTISYNKAKNGGAIAYTAGGSGSKNNIVITGGAIDNNTATTQGGAIFGAGSAYALIDMSAGALSNNTAKEGGAVKMGKGATFNLKGGEIFGNEGSGAAAYIYYGGTMNVSGGYIYSNHPKATTNNNGNAPAIYVAFSPSKLNVTGGNFGIDPEGNPAPNYYKQTDGASGLAYGSVVYSMNTASGANFVASEISGGNFYVEGNQYPFYDGRSGSADNVVTGGNINSLFRINYAEDDGTIQAASVCIADGYMAYEASNIGVKNMKYTFAPKFSIESTSVELKDCLNLNFILDTAELPAAAKDFEVSFSDGTTGKLVVDGDKCYAAYTGIAAKDMAKEISVTITNDGNEICKLENESIKAYADRALAAESTLTEAEKTAVADMLHYGAAAQTYFGVEGAKVNEGVTGGSAADVTIAAGTVAAEAEGKYVGSSVSLKNEIVLNMYFANTVESVTVNGEAVELVESGNYQVATITGIKLPEAKTALNVVVDGVAFSDSIEAYAFRAQNLGEADANLAALCQKMMNLVASVGELN